MATHIHMLELATWRLRQSVGSLGRFLGRAGCDELLDVSRLGSPSARELVFGTSDHGVDKRAVHERTDVPPVLDFDTKPEVLA